MNRYYVREKIVWFSKVYCCFGDILYTTQSGACGYRTPIKNIQDIQRLLECWNNFENVVLVECEGLHISNFYITYPRHTENIKGIIAKFWTYMSRISTSSHILEISSQKPSRNPRKLQSIWGGHIWLLYLASRAYRTY